MSNKIEVCGHLSKLVPKRGEITVIYGERGAGKTILLLNLFKCIIEMKNIPTLFISRKTIGILHQIKSLLSQNTYNFIEKNLFFCDIHEIEQTSENNCYNLLKKLLFFADTQKKPYSRRILIIDELVNFLALLNLEESSSIYSLLLLNKKRGNSIIISSNEDREYPVPSRENSVLLWLSDNYIRILKRGRIRMLYSLYARDANLGLDYDNINEIVNILKEKMVLLTTFLIRSGGKIEFIKEKRR